MSAGLIALQIHNAVWEIRDDDLVMASARLVEVER